MIQRKVFLQILAKENTFKILHFIIEQSYNYLMILAFNELTIKKIVNLFLHPNYGVYFLVQNCKFLRKRQLGNILFEAISNSVEILRVFIHECSFV